MKCTSAGAGCRALRDGDLKIAWFRARLVGEIDVVGALRKGMCALGVQSPAAFVHWSDATRASGLPSPGDAAYNRFSTHRKTTTPNKRSEVQARYVPSFLWHRQSLGRRTPLLHLWCHLLGLVCFRPLQRLACSCHRRHPPRSCSPCSCPALPPAPISGSSGASAVFAATQHVSGHPWKSVRNLHNGSDPAHSQPPAGAMLFVHRARLAAVSGAAGVSTARTPWTVAVRPHAVQGHAREA